MLRKWLKRLGWGFLLLFLLWSTFHLKWLVYGFTQAKGQLQLIIEARKVDDILADPQVPDSITHKLYFLDSVKTYAHEVLGLAKSDIYPSVFDQKGEPTMFVVTAAEPFQMISKEWVVPLLGNFPYLGFFDAQKAKKEWEKMQSKGYDTRIRIAEGWSTLGLFENPLLSNNLSRSRGDLANLIIHEIAHETIYRFGETEWNENVASFIGDQGTLQLLKDFYGDSSTFLTEYLLEQSDYEMYLEHFLKGAKYMEEMYSRLEGFSEEEKKKRKSEAIQQMVDNLDTLPLNRPEIYRDAWKETLPNNAYFLSVLRYRSDQSQFVKEWNSQFNSNLAKYIQYLKEQQ